MASATGAGHDGDQEPGARIDAGQGARRAQAGSSTLLGLGATAHEWSFAMKVKDAMHKGVEWVGPDTPVPEVAKKMKDLDVGAIPINDKKRMVGMLSLGDISRAASHELTGEVMAAVSEHHA